MALFSSLTHRPFALLWSGQTISRLGDRLYGIALAWWVLEKTGSATAMGTVLIFSSLPMLLFLLVGGVAVDRFSRPRVMFLSDLSRGVVVAGITTLAFGNWLEIWHIYLAGIIFGLVDAFFQPAYVATVPEITPSEALPSANSLTSLSGQMIGIVGPALGAGIVAFGGTPIAFGLDALSFFISAGFLIPLLGFTAPRRSTPEAPGILREVREGFSAVLASPWLWITIALASISNFTIGGPLAVSTPFLVRENLQAGVETLGFLYTMASVGSVLGALWLGHMKKIRHRGVLTYGAWVIGSLMVMAQGLPALTTLPRDWLIAGVSLSALLFGGALAIVNLIWANTLQELVPGEMLGRVSSIDSLGSFALNPIGYGVAGWATDRVGAPLVFIVGGALSAALGLLGLAHPAIRNLD